MGVSVMFLNKVLAACKSLSGSRVDALTNPHKVAAVAIIMRENRVCKRTEMLFIKRAKNERDVWSGDIAFPGGCHDSGDGSCGFDTVCREVLEETGLDLRDKKRYNHIGTLSERTTPRGRKHLTIIPFLFMDTRPVFENEYTICEKEISCLWWENVDSIDEGFLGLRDRYDIDIEQRFLTRFQRNPMQYGTIKFIIRLLMLSTCSFPCITLSPQNGGCKLFSPLGVNRRDLSGESEKFMLWGLTMSIFNELMFVATGKKNPHLIVEIKYNNAIFNAHFHFWQQAGVSWRNSIAVGSFSYVGSIILLLYGVWKVAV